MTTAVCPRCRKPMTASVEGGYCPRCAGRLLLECAPPEPDGEPTPTRPAGLRLGDYELGAELGRGAMGVVYRARQPRLQRDVAVKVILASRFAGETARKRFLAEASLGAQLDHPNIVPIFEVGETADGPFYAMKLVEGGTLAEEIQQDGRRAEAAPGNSIRPGPRGAGGPGIRGTAALMATIARAVHHAHQRGVLHRDLKPGNILLDAAGTPHITDFGLARQLGADSSLTASGASLGTPAYMAPEQAAGDKGITIAADVWSLGAILHHLLTGRPPFTGETAAEMLLQARTQASPSLRALNASIPRDLDIICLKCLEKDPGRRYATALELAEDLERWSRGEPIRARPATAPERFRLWCRRHPAIAGLSAAVGLLLLIVVVGSPIAAVRIARGRQAAEAASGRAQAELRNSLEAQARSGRLSRERGFRQQGLTAIAAAARLRPSLALRNEALAHLVSSDLDEEDWNVPFTPYEIVTQVAPDLGRYLVITNDLVSIRQWPGHRELALWKPVSTHAGLFRLLPDPRLLLIATNSVFELWDAEAGRALYRRNFRLGNFLSTHGCHDFSADGRLAAWLNIRLEEGKPEWEIVIHGLRPFQELARLRTGVAPVPGQVVLGQRIRLHPTRKSVAVLMGPVIEVRDWETGRVQERFENEVVWEELDWKQDVLAARDRRGVIHARNLRTGHSMLIPTRHPGRLLVSPDGQWLVHHDSQDDSASLFSPRTGQLQLTVAMRHPYAFDQDGRRLAYTRDTVGAGVLRLVRPRGFRTLLAEADVTQFDFSPDGQQLAAVTRQALHLLDVARGETLAVVTQSFAACRFLADGKTLVTSDGVKGAPNALTLWTHEPAGTPTGGVGRLQPGRTLPLPGTNGVHALSLGSDRRWLAAATGSGSAVVADLEHPDRAVRVRNSPSRLPDLSPDRRWLATAGRIVDAATGRTAHQLTNSEAHAATFSPDGRWLACATPRGFEAYRVGSWELLARYPAHAAPTLPRTQRARSVFSPDSRLLAVVSENQLRIELFETGRWEPVGTLASPEPELIHWLEFSPQGMLAVATERGLIQLWDLPVLRRELRELGLDWADPAIPAVP